MPGASPKDPQISTKPDTLEDSATSEQREAAITLVVHHPEGNLVRPLREGESISIGRATPADLVVVDDRLSRVHATFSWVEGKVVVADRESRNGTWIAGQRVSHAELGVGGEVMIGRTVVRICHARAPEQAGAPASFTLSPSSAHVGADLVAGATMRELLALIDRVAPSHAPVLLHGETGTGKELLARRLHEASAQGAGLLVSVNCGAIPEQLLESTLFGHERGAFTGAVQLRKGVFEEADGGTVFLDEIGELPPPAQVALLRVLETGAFSRVGSPRELHSSARIVAATHRDLRQLADRGEFRADLFYRLSTITLEIPPLRARREDIAPLALHFLRRANETNKRAVKGISLTVLAALEEHGWPGNARELRNAIEHAVVVTRADTIQMADLPAYLRGAPPSEDLPALDDDPMTSPSGTDLRAQLQRHEAQIIIQALRAAQGKRAAAARALGIPLRTLAHRIKTLGIRETSDDASE